MFFHRLANLASSAVSDILRLRHIVSPESTSGSFVMASLPNYLRTNRKRLALSQEEVAFLLGGTGENKGSKVSRDESYEREPGLRAAIAYELIYDQPLRELFAGLYEQMERELAGRAKILGHRKTEKENPKRQQVIAKLVSKLAA